MKFTQQAIERAVELALHPTGWPQYHPVGGLHISLNDHAAEQCTTVLYYLTLAVYYHEMEPDGETLCASNGTSCDKAVIHLLEFFLRGGNEPAASVGCWWGHGVMSNCLLLIKNTDSIYQALSQETKDKMEWLMKALAVAANWGYHDDNHYETGFNLCGNFDKSWNMNFQNAYLSIMLNATLYFGNDELSRILTEFDYDVYMDRFREYNFINIIYTWETAGKTLIETGKTAQGGNPILIHTQGLGGDLIGDVAGYGKGVKLPFRYTAVKPDGTKEVLTLSDKNFAQRLFCYLVEKTYPYKVQSSFGKKDEAEYCYILGDTPGSVRISPFEGKMGMFSELKATDGRGFRSSLVYPFDSFQILIGLYTNMLLFGDWDVSLPEVCELNERMYVGNEDLFFRMQYGYQAHCNGKTEIMSEQTCSFRGLLFHKDIWKKVHCGWKEDVALCYEIPNEKHVQVEKLMSPVMLRVDRDIWDEFVDFTKAQDISYVSKETVVITSNIPSNEVEVQYCMSSEVMTKQDLQNLEGWKRAKYGIACLKLEPYIKTYVYAKALDCEGNEVYVSNCFVLDTEAPTITGIENGKVYSGGRYIQITDRNLKSVLINGNEIKHLLSLNSMYYMKANSGKQHIVAKDLAGNVSEMQVRFSDTPLSNKVIFEGSDTNFLQTAQWSIEEISDYETLQFAMKIVSQCDKTLETCRIYFEGVSDTNKNARYFSTEIPVTMNAWQKYSIPLSSMQGTRRAQWDKMKTLRICAEGWNDEIAIYIQNMHLVPKEEQRVFEVD